jgi:5-methylcytosine-specific restriction enzyme subunit McrC
MTTNKLKEYKKEEQKPFSVEDKNEISTLLNLRNNPKLGLNYDSFGTLWTSYLIGIDWLEKDKSYILVIPKVKNLDYIKMFMHCLKHPEISQYVKTIYHFDFNKPKIIPDTQIEMDFNLFLIAHFLELTEQIVKQGLKKNYIQIEENLSSKIKGKIIWSQQIKKNIAAKREDRTSCRFQEYSVNCLENRLLKNTLLMIQRYLNHFNKSQIKPLIQQQNRLLNALEAVFDDISYQQIKTLKVNSLYKEYVEAIDLAKKIMQKFGYSFVNADNKDKQKEISPFWIDMSKLFELYVYSLLRDEYGNTVKYQLSADGKRQTHGNYGDVDFLKTDEKLIIDAKYKEVYSKNGKYDIEDIRQLSGYARDCGVLEKLNISNRIVDCVIIHPDVFSNSDFKNRKIKETPIIQFKNFWKCGIKLP